MSETAILKRQLAFRAWHRGTREADLLLGPFADSYLQTCSEEGVQAFVRLLEAEDPDLWDWVTGHKPVAPEFDNMAYQALLVFVAERQQ